MSEDEVRSIVNQTAERVCSQINIVLSNHTNELTTMKTEIKELTISTTKMEHAIVGNGVEGLADRAMKNASAIKWLTIGEIIIFCAVLGIDKLMNVI